MRFGKILLFMLFLFYIAGISAASGQGIQGMPVIQNFPVTQLEDNETHPASAYNILRDEFIVVWQDDRDGNANLYGLIIASDGSFVGNEFDICTRDDEQWYPAVDYNRLQDEYLVVWQNQLGFTNDIHGIRLNYDGEKIWSPRSMADTSFIVSDATLGQEYPKVAHNYQEDTYLVVWHDFRNDLSGPDIYGQRLDGNADLLLPVEMPAESPATDVNYPLSRGIGWDSYFMELYPDVAYHGGEEPLLNEWLVVFVRDSDEIWGVRVRGTDGMLLNTYGEVPQNLANNISFKMTVLGGPPWFPEFPVSHSHYGGIKGSPHVVSNARWLPLGFINRHAYDYPIPEFLVAWTDFRGGLPDIYCQRVGYFPDSTAVQMGLKQIPSADSLFTAVFLDSAGDWSIFPGWFRGANDPVTTHPEYQSWNDLTYDQTHGEYWVVWNDWRATFWDGNPPAPEADIYSQRLWLNPADTALIWLGDDGNLMIDRSVNIQIAATRSPDEGNMSYPAPAHGIVRNEFFVAYEYDMPANDDSIDVYGAFYAGDAISGFLVRIDVMPAEVDLNPGDQQQFEAHGFDGQGSEIYFKAIWSADGGDIDEQGVYTAPEQTGDYTVTALGEGSPVYGTALVHVWPTGVEKDKMIPAEFSLSQNYPNPFNSETAIPFGVKTQCHVVLKVYDLKGREVTTLIDENYTPGSYRVKLNSSDIASGIYLYQIRMGGFQAVRKLVVVE